MCTALPPLTKTTRISVQAAICAFWLLFFVRAVAIQLARTQPDETKINHRQLDWKRMSIDAGWLFKKHFLIESFFSTSWTSRKRLLRVL